MPFSPKSTVSLLTLALLSTLCYRFSIKDGNVELSLRFEPKFSISRAKFLIGISLSTSLLFPPRFKKQQQQPNKKKQKTKNPHTNKTKKIITKLIQKVVFASESQPCLGINSCHRQASVQERLVKTSDIPPVCSRLAQSARGTCHREHQPVCSLFTYGNTGP